MPMDCAELVCLKVKSRSSRNGGCFSCMEECINLAARAANFTWTQNAIMSQPALSDHVVAHMADTTVPPIIVMDKVNKWYGSLHVLRDVSLSVAEKERVVVCGPSGSGKSTMIRCLNRLEAHQDGKIVVDGIELTDDLRSLDTVRREVGMVFQSFNLFPI